METECCQEDADLLLRNLNKIRLILLYASTLGVSIETSFTSYGTIALATCFTGFLPQFFSELLAWLDINIPNVSCSRGSWNYTANFQTSVGGGSLCFYWSEKASTNKRTYNLFDYGKFRILLCRMFNLKFFFVLVEIQ